MSSRDSHVHLLSPGEAGVRTSAPGVRADRPSGRGLRLGGVKVYAISSAVAASRLTATLVVVRVLVAVAFAPFYGERRPADWLSPVADLLAVVRLTLSALRP